MLSHVTSKALVVVGLFTAMQGTSRADENFRWRVDYYDRIVEEAQTTYFETEKAALNYKQTYEKVEYLKKGGPAYINWKITKEPKTKKPAGGKTSDAENPKQKSGDLLARLRAAKSAVARALRSAAGRAGLASKELLLREVIDDYKKSVAAAYSRIKEFEKTLLSSTQEIQDKQFREINSMVDKYNRQITDFQSVMGPRVQLGFNLLPKYQPPAEKPDASETLKAQLTQLRDQYTQVKNMRDKILANRSSGPLDATVVSEANREIDSYNTRWRDTFTRIGKDFYATLAKYGIKPFGELYRISPDGLVVDDKGSTSGRSNTAKPAAAGIDPRAIDLSGSWSTYKTGNGYPQEGTLELVKAGEGYQGRWVQTYRNQFSIYRQAVQDVKVTVSQTGITVIAVNLTVTFTSSGREDKEHSYALDREYLTAQSADLLVGEGEDIAKRKSSSRFSRMAGQTD